MKTTTQERTGRVGQRRQVVIPQEILATLKLRAGDLVAFSEQKNGVVRYRVELSTEAQKQLSHFPRDVQARIERAIDELEAKDALTVEQHKGAPGIAVEGTLPKAGRSLPDHLSEAS
jgi:bifunctional DNA-binding transcriptional regulator/antitoxin component of YhaV-PrlF toxin-antitoxin module